MTDGNGHAKGLRMVPVADCAMLKRNPQYLTPAQMDSLKGSIKRDGFVVPILVRPIKGKRYEVVSGNHRFLAAQELGHREVPAVVKRMTAAQAQRLAINLNTVHGEPTAELMAPFLAEISDDVLRDIHLPDSLVDDLESFDATLAERLSQLQPVAQVDRDPAKAAPHEVCTCPKCGKKHVAARENSE